jgi:hypothetical protein
MSKQKSVEGIPNCDSRERRTFRFFRFILATVPLLQGTYAVAKWWGLPLRWQDFLSQHYWSEYHGPHMHFSSLKKLVSMLQCICREWTTSFSQGMDSTKPIQAILRKLDCIWFNSSCKGWICFAYSGTLQRMQLDALRNFCNSHAPSGSGNCDNTSMSSFWNATPSFEMLLPDQTRDLDTRSVFFRS